MRNRFVHKFTVTALLGVFSLGTLSACGIKGELKTPPPLWGDKSQAENAEKQNTDKSKQESNN